MKKLLFVFTLIVLLLPFLPQAKSQDVSVDFFYNNLNGGSWIEVGDYGYCWQPDIVASDPSWRPYADGYWAYTDLGWTWVSYEDWGWATYHYGRWVRLADYGWVWRPGYEWGPAWVSWRFGGGYCGWAPLPPETEVVYESRPLTGQLDVEFDIGPAYYNFVDVRYIGEPVLRSRIVDVNQNITYINQTVNVTNITYKNKTVYNYGPDLNVVNQYSSRPVQKLKLERQTNVDLTAAAKSGGLTKVQGNALVVTAPTKINKPAKEMAPPTVKTKVAQPKIEKGWSAVGDENAQKQFKEKIKTQDLKKVPPPTIGGAAATTGPAASAAPGASIAPGMAPVEKGKKKGKGAAQQFPAAATASPAGAALTSPTAGAAFPEKGKRKGKFGEQAQPGAPTSPMTSPSVGESPGAAPEYGKPGKGKRKEQFGQPPAGTTTPGEQFNQPRGGKNKKFEQPGMSPATPQNTPAEPQAGVPGEGRGKHKQFEQPVGPQNTPAGAQGGPYGGEPRGKHKQFEQQQPGTSPGAAEGTGPYGGEPRGKHRAEGVNQPPPGAANQPTPNAANQPAQPGERKHEGKGKGAVTPTPGPQ